MIDVFLQLKDREIWLQSQIKVEESIRQEVYNTEFYTVAICTYNKRIGRIGS